MRWAYLFNSAIRSRGFSYYKNGSVKKIQKKGNTYTGTVKGSGSHLYRVTIEIKDESIHSISCTCPYAMGNIATCKHEAAVLYMIENQPEQIINFSPDPPEKEDPPLDPSVLDQLMASPGEYTYFHPEEMGKSLPITTSMWEKALDFVHSGKIILNSMKTDFPSSYYSADSFMNLDITGIFPKSTSSPYMRPEVHMTCDPTHILQCRCTYRGCGTSYDSESQYGAKLPCIHGLALYYLAGLKMKKEKPGDATDRNGKNFLDRFQFVTARNLLQDMADAVPGETLEMEARINDKYYEGPSVSFRIGSKSLYIIKDLTQFVKQMEQKQLVQFGTKTTLKLGEEYLTEQGKRYYSFIKKYITEQNRANSYYYRSYHYASNIPENIKQELPLFGQRIDDLFDAIGSNTIELSASDESRKSRKNKVFLTCRDAVLPLSLVLSPVYNVNNNPAPCSHDKNDPVLLPKAEDFDGICVSGSLPETINGANASYYIDPPYFNRISKDRVKEIAPLADMAFDGIIQFTIGRRNLSQFYYKTLPWMRRIADVDESEIDSVQSFLPPEAHFSFYLDAEDTFISCRAEVSYGDQLTIPLIQREHDEILPETFRDPDREYAAAQTILQFFPFIQANGLYYSEKEEDSIFQILADGVDHLLALGDVHSTDRFRKITIRKTPKLSVGISLDNGLLDLSVSADDISNEELLEILKSYRKKKKFFRLKNGDFLNLEEDDESNLFMLESLLNELQISPKDFVKGKMHLPAYRALYLNHLIEQSEELYAQRDRRFKQLIREFKSVNDTDFEIPDHLKTTMRNYQAEGYKWLRLLDHFGFGGILADEMGLGKTLQAISVLSACKNENGHCHTLVISPASLVYNWYEEIRRFAPELRAVPVSGTQNDRQQILEDHERYDILITSYDLLKRDIDQYETIKFDFQILDEAQYIKNHTTAASKAVKVIHSKTRLALTGTPIENRLSELWSIFDYLMPGFLYKYETFKKSFETPIVKNKEEEASKRLRQMTSPFILRRLKKDVLRDLPEKLEEVRYAKPEKKQLDLYNGQLVHMQKLLKNQKEEEFNKNKLKVLAELTRIRQICCDPSLCFENYNGGSAKREACMELITSASESGHKMLVFSQFTSMLELLENDLKEAGISWYKITGSTPKEERLRLVKAFNEDNVPVFLISLKAGGTGLNLTGADIVIHYDPWWNLAVQNQATDRAHRLGQTKTVTVYKLIMKDSIEEKILKMQEAKKDLADEILKGENGNLASLSQEELRELIEG